MGMYTEFVFGAMLHERTPKNVLRILENLCEGEGDYNDLILPNHEFFACDRWRWIATMSSYYFGAPSHSTIVEDSQGGHRISIRANLKDYDNEIDKFVDWIKQYVEQGAGNRGLLGYQIYEGNTAPKMYWLIEDDDNE